LIGVKSECQKNARAEQYRKPHYNLDHRTQLTHADYSESHACLDNRFSVSDRLIGCMIDQAQTNGAARWQSQGHGFAIHSITDSPEPGAQRGLGAAAPRRAGPAHRGWQPGSWAKGSYPPARSCKQGHHDQRAGGRWTGRAGAFGLCLLLQSGATLSHRGRIFVPV